MAQEIDDKGKIFTEVVQKQPVQVIIQTRTNQIHGTMHKRSDQRLTDKLNDDKERFIPITNAVVLDVDGKTELQKTNFLALNHNEIIWLIETGEK